MGMSQKKALRAILSHFGGDDGNSGLVAFLFDPEYVSDNLLGINKM